MTSSDLIFGVGWGLGRKDGKDGSLVTVSGVVGAFDLGQE